MKLTALCILALAAANGTSIESPSASHELHLHPMSFVNLKDFREWEVHSYKLGLSFLPDMTSCVIGSGLLSCLSSPCGLHLIDGKFYVGVLATRRIMQLPTLPELPEPFIGTAPQPLDLSFAMTALSPRSTDTCSGCRL